MSFLDLRNEVKSVISKQLSNDMKIGKVFMSKHYDFQNYFLVRLYLMTNMIKLDKHLGVFLMMMFLIMVKYIRYLMF
jgi:hypothetical protein